MNEQGLNPFVGDFGPVSSGSKKDSKNPVHLASDDF